MAHHLHTIQQIKMRSLHDKVTAYETQTKKKVWNTPSPNIEKKEN